MNRFSAPYPYNLLNDVFETRGASFPSDLNKNEISKLNIIMQSFGIKEYTIAILYYKDQISMRNIGKQFGISVTQIRQILMKVVRKLAHPSRIKQYWNGYSKWLESQFQGGNYNGRREQRDLYADGKPEK